MDKKLYDRLKQSGVETVQLNFSGGSDEGYLDVWIRPQNDSRDLERELEREVEEWAWEHYDYSGAGDGTSYGDRYFYDLVNNTISHEEWFHEIAERDLGEIPLETSP
jgi:hypothetical protein